MASLEAVKALGLSVCSDANKNAEAHLLGEKALRNASQAPPFDIESRALFFLDGSHFGV